MENTFTFKSQEPKSILKPGFRYTAYFKDEETASLYYTRLMKPKSNHRPQEGPQEIDDDRWMLWWYYEGEGSIEEAMTELDIVFVDRTIKHYNYEIWSEMPDFLNYEMDFDVV